MPLVYDELRKIARAYVRQQPPGQTLQATALANEAYLHLVGTQTLECRDRAHFFAVTAQVMRRILVDRTRARHAAKRQAGALRVTFNEQLPANGDRDVSLLAIDEALEALAKCDARKARVVELRYFGGLTVEETAEVLKISPQSVLRDWKLSKAWLARQLSRSDDVES
jgi:RNA polymerase sigma factor (TIGR02999 family)